MIAEVPILQCPLWFMGKTWTLIPRIQIPSAGWSLRNGKKLSLFFTAQGKVENPHSIHSFQGGSLSGLPYRAQLLKPQRDSHRSRLDNPEALSQDSTPGFYLLTCSFPTEFPSLNQMEIQGTLWPHFSHLFKQISISHLVYYYFTSFKLSEMWNLANIIKSQNCGKNCDCL